MIPFPGWRSSLSWLLFLSPAVALAGQGFWTSNGPQASISAIAIAGSGTVIAAGRPTGSSQDAVFTGSASEAAWVERAQAPPGVTITALAVDSSNPTTVYATGDVDVGTRAGAIYVSRDNGATWSFLHLFEDSPISALAIDPIHPATLYAGGYVFSQANGTYAAVAFRSSDAGVTWSSLSLPPGALGVAAFAINPKQSNQLYLATNCELSYSDNSGASWTTRLGSSLPQYCVPITSVAVSPSDFQIVSVGFFRLIHSLFFDGGVTRTRDGGRSWLGTTLHAPVFSIALDPGNPNVVYAGAGLGFGVLATRDGGMSWSRLGDLPQTSAIQLDPLTETIYAATSSGVFEYEITLTPLNLVPNNRTPRQVPSRR